MAVVNANRGWVFLANPHTASRAVVESLMKIDGSVETGAHHSELEQTVYSHPAATECETVFTGVRHPLDWLTSVMVLRGATKRNFSDVLRYVHEDHLFWRFRGQATDFYRFEHMEEDLTRIIGGSVDIDLDPDHITQGKRVDYMSYWTQDDIDYVVRRWAADFDKFGYSKDITATI
jgi:hypothetical protein